MIPRDITNVDELPSCAVLSAKQMAALMGISTMTLWELSRDRTGPPRVQLSKFRFGYPVGSYREWLKQRELTGTLPWRRSPGEAA